MTHIQRVASETRPLFCHLKKFLTAPTEISFFKKAPLDAFKAIYKARQAPLAINPLIFHQCLFTFDLNSFSPHMQLGFLEGLDIPPAALLAMQDAAARSAIDSLTIFLESALTREENLAKELAIAQAETKSIRDALTKLRADLRLPSATIVAQPISIESTSDTGKQVDTQVSNPLDGIQAEWSRDKKLMYILQSPEKYGYPILDKARVVEVLKKVEHKAVNKLGIKKYSEGIGQALSKLALKGNVAKYVKRTDPNSLPSSTYYVSLSWFENNILLPEHESAVAGLEFIPVEPKLI
jgi:hypothetical protein